MVVLLAGAFVTMLSAPAAGATGIALANDSTLDAARLGITAAVSGLPEEERALLLALESITGARLDDAERQLRAVLRRHPTFHLARLVLADVLMARGGRFVDFASGAAGGRVETLRAEALARLASVRVAARPGRVPDVLLKLSPSQTRALVVDLATSRLYLFENADGHPALRRSFYISMGKNGPSKRREGDQRTPVGAYFVTGRISGDALPDFYGPGALPVNYPNEWDVRQQRTGYGIWIHGVPSDTFSRAPRASDGCIALSNEHATLLLNLPQAKDTPVIIADGLRWLDAGGLARRRQGMLDNIEAWRRDWESRDVARYARHYSRAFRSESWDRARWVAHKQRVNAGKRYIRVRLDDMSVFAYPGEQDMAVVSFVQDYSSSNFSSRSRKRQYWKREQDGQWRIVYEGSAKLRRDHLRGIPFSARSRVSAR